MEPKQTTERATQRENLRLALSMRGGVSLAVWIGGAVAEVDTLRKASTTAQAGQPAVYRSLLDLANYGTVDVDILTGASAGGLNGAIYAASLVYGFDFAATKNIWLEVGDVEALSRPTTSWPGDEQPPSLFEGDDYFYARCCDEIDGLIATSAAASVEHGDSPLDAASRLDLFLSATLRDPVERVLRNDAYGAIHESRSAAFFHFRHLGSTQSPLSDFAPDATDDPNAAPTYRASAQRLALSGRASSSFPIAFEPATVHSVANGSDHVTIADGVTAPNLFGVFSDPGEVQVLDGGVLDNIPVARAIEAIAAAPADGPSARWLLYLHPSPNQASDEQPTHDDARSLASMLSDVGRAIALKFDSESLVDDMVELDRHNREVAERRRARLALIATDGVVSDLSSYPDAWAEADAERIRELLADPILSTATHPFVTRAQRPLDHVWRADRLANLEATLTDVLAAGYQSVFEPALGDRIDLSQIDPPLLALGDLVEALLEITQLIANGGPVERQLYRLRLTIEVLHSIWEQTWLDACAGYDGEPITTWVEQRAAAARSCSERVSTELLDALDTDAGAVRNSHTSSDSDADTEAELALHRALQRLHHAAVAPGPDAPNLEMVSIAALWDHTEELVRRLDLTRSDDPIVEAVHRAAQRDGGLAALAVTTAALHRRVLSGSSQIRFLRISGANESPFSDWFADRFNVENKLAGNQVFNFGAFFSANWRANDWMWGRLDASKSLVDLLCDSERWFRGGVRSVDDVEAALRAIVAEPFASGDEDWTSIMLDRWGDRAISIRRELEAAETAARNGLSHGLVATKAMLVERLQAEGLSRDLPWVDATPPVLDQASPPDPAPATPERTEAIARSLRAGTDRLPSSLDPKRWARIGMRLGLTGWNSLRPRRWFPRAIMSALKPIFLSLLAAVAFPRRGLAAGVIGFGALAVGRWEMPSDFVRPFTYDSRGVDGYVGWERLTALVLTVVLSLIITVVHLRSRLPRDNEARTARAMIGSAGILAGGFACAALAIGESWTGALFALTLIGVLAAAPAFLHPPERTGESWRVTIWLGPIIMGMLGGAVLASFVFQHSLAPVIVPIVSVGVVLIGFDWMPKPALLGAIVIAVAPYLLSAWLIDPNTWGWWVLTSFALAVLVMTCYVTLVPVLPSVRLERSEGASPRGN